MNRKGILGAIILGILIFGGIILTFLCLERVPAGYVGVVYNMSGGVDGEVLTQGFHLVSPTKKVTTYSIGIEQSYLTAKDEGDSKSDDSFEVSTSDGKGLTVDLTFTYRFDPDKVADTFTRFRGQSGSEVKNSFIKPNIISWTKEITAKYPVTEILGDYRAALNTELTEYLKGKFEPYGIIIESVSLINIDADEETRAAIQKKINAQQELEMAKVEADTAKVQANKDKEVALIAAEQEKEKATIEAERKKIAAEGEAEAIRIAAEAQAEANKKIADSLTPELIENNKIDKWDGSVPQVQGSATPIIDMTADAPAD